MSLPLPKVSIIIDNFNYDRFLAAAIDSALAQTYPNCEVIVVDDGSTDRSRQILETYSGRVQVLLKENGGQASAFNLGFKQSEGHLVGFLDSDDGLFPSAIATAVSYWQKSIVKVQFPLEVLDPDNSPTGLLMPRAPLSDGNVLPDYLLTGRYVTSPTSGNLFSREFLQQIFPIPEKEWAQTADGYMNTCAPFFGPVKAVREPLAFYRVHGMSMSSVSLGDSIDIKQMEKLIGHALLEKNLLQNLAKELGYRASSTVVVGHWMHLKLKIAFYKLSDISWLQRSRLLFSAARDMVLSIVKASELSFFRKIQNLVWVVGVVFLPSVGARPLIAYAFNPSPASPFARMLRRV